jgi:hypothetical protein
VLKEVAHESILDLSEPAAQARQFAQPQIDLFADLAAYGSNLVIRGFNSSHKGMAEVIVCGVHLKQVRNDKSVYLCLEGRKIGAWARVACRHRGAARDRQA